MKTAEYRFSVCPHDTAKNLGGWFLLNTYLQRKLNCSIHFEPCDSFVEERGNVFGNNYHIVYTNPYSALLFNAELGFVPLARPMGIFDETFLVAKQGAGLPADKIKIAAATDQLIVYDLGLILLEAQGIARARCDFSFVGTHLKAVHSVLQDNCDMAFVFNETWQGLAESTRQKLTVVAESSSRQAYHCFCVAPEWMEKYASVQAVLCGMRDEPQGKHILDDLHFTGFEASPPNALDALRTLVRQVA